MGASGVPRHPGEARDYTANVATTGTTAPPLVVRYRILQTQRQLNKPTGLVLCQVQLISHVAGQILTERLFAVRTVYKVSVPSRRCEGSARMTMLDGSRAVLPDARYSGESAIDAQDLTRRAES